MRMSTKKALLVLPKIPQILSTSLNPCPSNYLTGMISGTSAIVSYINISLIRVVIAVSAKTVLINHTNCDINSD